MVRTHMLASAHHVLGRFGFKHRLFYSIFDIRRYIFILIFIFELRSHGKDFDESVEQ